MKNVLLPPIFKTDTREGRYGVGLDGDDLVILSYCCGASVYWSRSAPTKEAVICSHCDRGFGGYSDTTRTVRSHDAGGAARWISAWTKIPQSDITITVEER